MTAKRARDIARSLEVVPAHDQFGTALARLGRTASRHVVAMDGDEIAALLDCKQLEDLDASAPHLKHEMIGNLDGITFRLCRDDDDVGRVADLLLRSKAEAAVVVLPNGEAQGVILASDLAGLTGTG